MPLRTACQKVVEIIKANNLQTEDYSNADIEAYIEGLYHTGFGGASPLQMVSYLMPQSVISIYEYDDCNAYQDPGYYESELQKISAHSQGGIEFSELKEDCDDEGVFTLSYTLNGKAGTLSFSCIDTYDSVPEPYLKFVKKIIHDMTGNKRYLTYVDDVFRAFCLLPNDVADELEKQNLVDFISTNS